MIRKLIQLSPSTAVVSMPAKWIADNNLKKGAALNVETIENAVIISAFENKTQKEITIDISKLSKDLMWRYVDAAYVSGYDSIILITANRTQTEYIAAIVKSLPGMMIDDERIGVVHIKSLSDSNQDDVDKILSRIYNITITLIQDSLQAIEKKEWDTLNHAKKKDYLINSYTSFCLRQLNKHGYKTFSKSAVLHTYIKLIEMLSDKIVNLLTEIGEKKKFAESILLEKILTQYRMLSKLRFSYTQQVLLQFSGTRDILESQASKKSAYKSQLDDIINVFRDIEEVEIQLNT